MGYVIVFTSIAAVTILLLIDSIRQTGEQTPSVSLMYQEFDSILSNINACRHYNDIVDIETHIEYFEYSHMHEVGCDMMVRKLNKVYNDRKHELLQILIN